MYAGLYVSSILYDNLDGLKIGLDTALLKFSRAALNYYQKHGLVTRHDATVDAFEDDTRSATSEEIALFTHYLEMLDNNVTQLAKERTLQVANHLIASSTNILKNSSGVVCDKICVKFLTVKLSNRLGSCVYCGC